MGKGDPIWCVEDLIRENHRSHFRTCRCECRISLYFCAGLQQSLMNSSSFSEDQEASKIFLRSYRNLTTVCQIHSVSVSSMTDLLYIFGNVIVPKIWDGMCGAPD